VRVGPMGGRCTRLQPDSLSSRPGGELGFVGLPGMHGELAAPRCGGGAVGPDGAGRAGVLRGGRQISSAWSLMPVRRPVERAV
jgi:hypothetical protein